VATTVKTDNAHTPSKVGLRVMAVEMLGAPRRVSVLDAFHGHGQLWKLTAAELGEQWDVHIFRTDHQERAAGTLKIDNARLLAVIDLTRFDVIDLDAYGWPTDQLRLVAERAPHALVLTTRIPGMYGRIPNVIIDDLGLVAAHDAPASLLSSISEELWEAWLYALGYDTSYLVRYEATAGGMVKRYEICVPRDWSPERAAGWIPPVAPGGTTGG